MNPALKFVAKIATHNMKEKLRGGLQFHSTADELADFMDLRNLPKEYGGDYSLEKIIGECRRNFDIIVLFQNLILLEPYRKSLKTRRDFFISYSQMKINQEYYTPAVLRCETGTLNYTLENKKGKLLTKYQDESDSDSD
jgi:hypothetical protein